MKCIERRRKKPRFIIDVAKFEEFVCDVFYWFLMMKSELFPEKCRAWIHGAIVREK